MAEFCTCGSILIAGNCTNKNCVNKASSKPGASKASAGKAASKIAGGVKKEPKSPRTRRASKCIVYNLYEDKKEENVE